MPLLPSEFQSHSWKLQLIFLNICILNEIPEQQLHLIKLPQQESSEAQGLQRKPLARDAILEGDETRMPHSYWKNTFLSGVYRLPQGITITDLLL